MFGHPVATGEKRGLGEGEPAAGTRTQPAVPVPDVCGVRRGAGLAVVPVPVWVVGVAADAGVAVRALVGARTRVGALPSTELHRSIMAGEQVFFTSPRLVRKSFADSVSTQFRSRKHRSPRVSPGAAAGRPRQPLQLHEHPGISGVVPRASNPAVPTFIFKWVVRVALRPVPELGFEPRTCGLWARRAAELLHSGSRPPDPSGCCGR